ncbi:MAG: hypothetical protein H0W87_09905 [Actinobacteria bacterium]|nr:hypothetical protein [Actinomycetota bacterium]
MTGARLFLLTGPSAAGKSTVGRLLARRFERGVHLEGDVFRRSIVSGREEPLPDLSPDIGLWLDSSGQTPEQTVDEIVRRTAG